MILEMSRLRILGPRDAYDGVVRALQDAGVLHLASPPSGPQLEPLRLSPTQERERRCLRRVLEDVEVVFDDLHCPGRIAKLPPGSPPHALDRSSFMNWARKARRLRQEIAYLRQRAAGLEEERALILKYRYFLSAFGPLLTEATRAAHLAAYHIVLRPDEAKAVEGLRSGLEAVIGDAFDLRSRRLATGETAVLLLVAAAGAERVERLLAEARVQEIPVPVSFGGGSLAEAVPRMRARLEAIPEELAAGQRRLDALAAEHGGGLRAVRSALHDRLGELEALPLLGVTRRAFVIEGWAPAARVAGLRESLAREFGRLVVIRELGDTGEEAPVALSNPVALRPFELVIRLLPLPRYHTVDPTPFVALFFPLFFGLMLGDVAYGVMLAGVSAFLCLRSRPGTVLRSAAVIATVCAGWTIVFGLLFGELLGDLGRRLLGLRALAFDREEAMLTFLGLAIAIGFAHVLLGLALGVRSAWRDQRRLALGRGVAAVMVVLVGVAVLAGAGPLPAWLLRPAIVGLVVALPLLLALEGVIAAVELLSTLGNILSYARLMALGTASVMLALVANQMAGAMGSLILGGLVALLFHLLNFVLGVFSPTIHALRLHYVEFFGKFYSAGGVPYRPLARWGPEAGARI